MQKKLSEVRIQLQKLWSKLNKEAIFLRMRSVKDRNYTIISLKTCSLVVRVAMLKMVKKVRMEIRCGNSRGSSFLKVFSPLNY
jgi:hypothetical protein